MNFISALHCSAKKAHLNAVVNTLLQWGLPKVFTTLKRFKDGKYHSCQSFSPTFSNSWNGKLKPQYLSLKSLTMLETKVGN